MTNIPEGATPQLVLTHAQFVDDIVAAFRSELAHSIPVFLAPLLDDLHHLKDKSMLILQDCDKICAAPALAALSPALPLTEQVSVSPLADANCLPGVAAPEDAQPYSGPSSGKTAPDIVNQPLNGAVTLAGGGKTAGAAEDAFTPPLDGVLEECNKNGCEGNVAGDQAAKPKHDGKGRSEGSFTPAKVKKLATPPSASGGRTRLIVDGAISQVDFDGGISPQRGVAGVLAAKTKLDSKGRSEEPVTPAEVKEVATPLATSGDGTLLIVDGAIAQVDCDGAIALLPSEPTCDSLPMDIETQRETSRPLLDAAGPPEECSVPRQGLFGWLCSLRSHEQRGISVYRYDSLVDPATNVEMYDDDGLELVDPEAAQRLPDEIASLEAQVKNTQDDLNEVDALWQSRRRPYDEDIASFCKDIEKLKDELELARMPKNREPPPPGPASLRFLETETFNAVCNLVVVLNLTAMILGPKYKSYAATFKALDEVFLAWYVVEISTKALYYQRNLLFGKISVVWWNWMDLSIVVGGVVDQWLLPLVMAVSQGELDIDVSSLRMLRVLRLFRIMRFLKLIKATWKSDWTWTEGATFEWGMASVIALNSIIMSLELDIPWAGWLYVENFLQVVYTFELTVRFKKHGCMFFIDIDNMVWNHLDFIMVCGGALDLWLVPLIYALQELFLGREIHHSSSFSDFLRILKIMRILRVLRLVRLLKMVKPLYRLLIGVIASVKAMQWVVVLTFLMLYAASIVFTNLVGKGLMSNNQVTQTALTNFGSVPKAWFSLFKLMNGDMSVVEPITGSITGKLLFACFMVVSNWTILAVLTAVVSENMITTSQKASEEDEQQQNAAIQEKRIRRLTALFKEIDHDGGGTISYDEWNAMMNNDFLHREICHATGLPEGDLNDYFECLAKDPKQEERFNHTIVHMTDLHMDYRTFIEALNDENKIADRKSILQAMKYVRILENQLKRDFEKLGKPKAA